MSTWILHIETATKTCSVALSNEGVLIDELTELGDGFVHGERLTLLINDLIIRNNLTFKNLKAISISIGPGSYTGLRIGLSTVKGICFALNIPIIPLNTLEIIAKSVSSNSLIIALMDAKRMEVYAYGIDQMKKEIFSAAPVILTESTFIEFDPFLCLGDGAEKTKEIWKNRNVHYHDDFKLEASNQVNLAFELFKSKNFAKSDSLVPNYLKDFQFNVR